MTKNIALYCDGSWQHLDQPYPTNVAGLCRATLPEANGGRTQVIYYDDGVGVAQGVADNLTRILGGALGQGLDYKIQRAYQFLCLNYVPGDRIFIFGFSRGAYTARSLAGLLRLIWILRRESAPQAGQAMALYRKRPPKTAPQAAQDSWLAQVASFRKTYCLTQQPFRGEKAYDPEDPGSLVPEGEDCAWLQYVGVWDTVGALGIPSRLPLAGKVNAAYQFYDTDLSRFVRSARHAVSIDERRDSFQPTLWDNIDGLNANAVAQALAYEQRPYQQVWFPGGHGCVGGGGDDGGISAPPMLWIAEGAARAGLDFDRAQLTASAQGASPTAPFAKESWSLGSLFVQAQGMSDRRGPDRFDEVSTSARLRWADQPSAYRPAPLRRAADLPPALAAWVAPAPPKPWFDP